MDWATNIIFAVEMCRLSGKDSLLKTIDAGTVGVREGAGFSSVGESWIEK
jgi:hypothetical protein